MSEAALVEIHNATICRGSTRVFEGLSLRIEQHERVAILGPNGCGKTTLLKAINRELYPIATPDSYIKVLGKERWNVWQLRRQIGVVSHDLHQRYTPTTTAIEVVLSGFHASIGVHGAIAGRITPAQRRAALAVLSDLGIAGLCDTTLAHMSTGQQRRVLLGRALVHQPATLVLDEPTAGLDLTASFEYLRRLRELARKGVNIVLVTHHLSDIPPEVERIILLSRGRVVADGDKAAVLTSDVLSSVYDTPIRLIEKDGYYLAYPGKRPRSP